MSKVHHSERCKLCKSRIQELLRAAYGRVLPNHKRFLAAKVADLPPSPHNEVLGSIYAALQQSRGHTDFPRRTQLPHVDFFLPDQKMIVEVDESQHFTALRCLTLSLYPKQICLGFPRERWRQLCQTLDKRDNDPIDRDETRAWYDTLRDFAPQFLSLKPTVRLYIKDYVWCSFSPSSKKDIAAFKSLIKKQQEGST
jgi:hypothetical protein